MNFSNHTWIPPDDSFDLVFNNCAVASKFSKTYWSTQDLPLLATIQMLRDGISTYLAYFDYSAPTDFELFQWMEQEAFKNNTKILGAMIDFTIAHCMDDLCPQLGWRGNADLAGKGVLINYFIQASLTTAYFLVIVAMDFERIQAWVDKSSYRSRTVEAVRYSARVFLDSAILYQFSMLIATLSFLNRRGLTDSYSDSFMISMSQFSVIPAMMLHVSVSKDLRRSYMRALLWTVTGFSSAAIFVFWLITIFVHTSIRMTSDEVVNNFMGKQQDNSQAAWEVICMDDSYLMLPVIVPIAVICICFAIHIGVKNTRSRNFAESTAQQHSPILRPETSSLCTTEVTNDEETSIIDFQVTRCFSITMNTILFAGMWSTLGLLYNVREQYGKRGGITNQENEFSFGQILALSTWVPVLVEFCYVWWQGPEGGLTGQLMKPYRATSAPHPDDHDIEIDEGLTDDGFIAWGQSAARKIFGGTSRVQGQEDQIELLARDSLRRHEIESNVGSEQDHNRADNGDGIKEINPLVKHKTY